MTIEDGKVILPKRPRENMARPAIDPMFRSAARTYGSSAIGVILTGGLSDGTAGLHEVKARGGTAAVSMPRRRGSGSNLIENALSRARVERKFLPAGLECSIEVPLILHADDPLAHEEPGADI